MSGRAAEWLRGEGTGDDGQTSERERRRGRTCSTDGCLAHPFGDLFLCAFWLREVTG